MTVSWDIVPGATTYNLWRSTTRGGPYTLIAENIGGVNLGYVDHTAANGTTYYLRRQRQLGTEPARIRRKSAQRLRQGKRDQDQLTNTLPDSDVSPNPSSMKTRAPQCSPSWLEWYPPRHLP